MSVAGPTLSRREMPGLSALCTDGPAAELRWNLHAPGPATVAPRKSNASEVFVQSCSRERFSGMDADLPVGRVERSQQLALGQ